jgi:hypothetical protein
MSVEDIRVYASRRKTESTGGAAMEMTATRLGK